jgi:cytochrome c553
MRALPNFCGAAILAMLAAQPIKAATDAPPSRLGLCAACHGEDGRARIAGYPHLHGQDAAYLLEQLKAYKSGRREHAQMRAAVGSLSEAHLRELAQWYAKQDPCDVRAQQTDR